MIDWETYRPKIGIMLPRDMDIEEYRSGLLHLAKDVLCSESWARCIERMVIVHEPDPKNIWRPEP